MSHQPRPRIHLHDEGDFIAAVPYMLGYRPENSLVVTTHTKKPQQNIALCLRSDIPPEHLYQSLAEQLKIPITGSDAASATILVICNDSAKHAPPHRALVNALTETFNANSVTVHDALWAPDITAGARWSCYSNPERSGQIPDPKASAIAIASTMSGSITYDSKADMRASLEPCDANLLSHRSKRISAALRHSPNETSSLKLVDDTLTQASDETLNLDDNRIVDLAVALTHVHVRDHCLKPEVTRRDARIEQLWVDLTRALPAPYRAESAFLLAVTAYLRGDGALAGIALDVARQANPAHRATRIMRHAMDMGLRPDAVAEALAIAFPQQKP
ncbi:DUF4192 domain-containing protein [Kibdelosporangium philippinense]|uniref:DUF4192 domain-containing protein n=1 Tax=Kibdelosporangium philippinense TaxID=211113 RepID=A0ABS8ZQ99_9PSEU|nr:DUF4192 domain-containing protein [Kibdelosporangium philippinense]MCE7009899.1 DUF4192 domain-containing protein [Kibdelosporangium philippinense]